NVPATRTRGSGESVHLPPHPAPLAARRRVAERSVAGVADRGVPLVTGEHYADTLLARRSVDAVEPRSVAGVPRRRTGHPERFLRIIERRRVVRPPDVQLDVRVQARDGFHVRGFVGYPAGSYRAGKSGSRRGVKGRKRESALPQLLGRNRSDGRGVE